MRCKFSLSSCLHAAFYSAKKRCVVLHSFAAGDKVQSQKLQARQETAHVDLFAPRFSRGAAPEVPKAVGPVFIYSLSFNAAFTTM